MTQSSFDAATGSNRKWWFIGGGCLALFACACVVVVATALLLPEGQLTTLRQLLGLSSADVGAIEYAPAGAPMFAVVNPNFSQLSSFAKLKAIFDKNPAYAKRLDELASQTTASTNGELDFQRDIQPWLGAEIAVLMLDAPVVGSSTPPDVVVIAATRDRAKSDEAFVRIRKQAQDKGATFADEDYKGVKITVSHGSSGTASTLAYATVQNNVLIGTNADAVKKAIDAKQSGGKSNLVSSAAYQQVMAQLPKDRVGALFVDLQALAQDAPASASAEVSALRGAGISLSFTDDGVRLDYATAFDVSKAPPAFKQLIDASQPTRGVVLDRLPVSTILALTGQNLKGIWTYYRDIIGRDPATSKALENMQTETGINLEDDVFAWMTGEFAVSVVPAKPLSMLGPNAPAVGALLLIETSDPAVAKTKMDKIAGVLAKQGLLFAKKSVNGVEMQVLSGLEQQGLTVGYGFLDNFLELGSSADVLGSAVDARSAPLSKDGEFLQATKSLLQPRTSMTFVSLSRLVEAIKPALTGSQLTDFQTNVEPLLKPFKSLSAAVGVPKDAVQAGVLFVHIAE